MIVFDTESTDLVQPQAAGLAKQPHLIEITMLLLDDATLREIDVYTTLVRPPVAISPKITKITGITNAMVADAPTFREIESRVRHLLCYHATIIAHNLAHDFGVLDAEFARLTMDIEAFFPLRRICTVEYTAERGLKDRKMTTLYEALLGTPLAQTHRSEDDVRALAEIVRVLRQERVL